MTLIYAGAGTKWLEPAPHKTYFYIFKRCVERALPAIRSRKDRTDLIEAAATWPIERGDRFRPDGTGDLLSLET